MTSVYVCNVENIDDPPVLWLPAISYERPRKPEPEGVALNEEGDDESEVPALRLPGISYGKE